MTEPSQDPAELAFLSDLHRTRLLGYALAKLGEAVAAIFVLAAAGGFAFAVGGDEGGVLAGAALGAVVGAIVAAVVLSSSRKLPAPVPEDYFGKGGDG